MRRFQTGRGLHPPLNATTLHAWPMDESAASDDARDLIGSDNLTQVSAPAVITGWIGPKARTFGGTDESFASAATGADKVVMVGDISITIAFRVDSSTSNDATLVAYKGSESSINHNSLFTVWYDESADKVGYFWEFAAADSCSGTFDYVFTRGSWYIINVVRDVSGQDIYLYVNGVLQSTKSYSDDPATGAGATNQSWRVGDSLNFVNFFGDISWIDVNTAVLTADECRDCFRNAMMWNAETNIHTKVYVEDGSGTDIDLCSLAETDWVTGFEIDDNSDTYSQNLTVRLAREQYDLSLSKYHDNMLNRLELAAPDDVYDENAEMLATNREIKVYACRVPMDVAPVAADYKQIFYGTIDGIEWAGDEISIKALDLGGILLRACVEDNSTKYPKTSGACSALYGPVETAMQDILDDADTNDWISGAAPSIYVPVSPVWCTLMKTVDRGSILQVINQQFAEQIGWNVRYRWDDATSEFLLTFWEPDRDKSKADLILRPVDYFNYSKL